MIKVDCLEKLAGIERQLLQLEKMLEDKITDERKAITDKFGVNLQRVENKLQYLELATKKNIQRVS